MSDDHRNAYRPLDLTGQPEPQRPSTGQRRRPIGRRLVAVATGTTIALGAGGIAWAATDTPTPEPPQSSDPAEPDTAPTAPEKGVAPAPDDAGSPGWRFSGHGPGGLPFFGGGPGGMPLHGEQVVETSDGTYETIATQRGTVDAVSADELTVTSEDGFSRTYTLTADSLVDERSDEALDLAVGDEVMVVATVEGSTATVTHAIDLDSLPSAPEERAFPRGGPDGPGAPPESDPNDTTTEGSAA